MSKRAVNDAPEALKFVPDHFKTKKMCERALRMDPCNLEFVPDYFKTQKIYDKAVKGDLYSLLFVPDWFGTQKQLKYGMMTMSIAMMMNLLSGTMAIKNVRPRKYK